MSGTGFDRMQAELRGKETKLLILAWCHVEKDRGSCQIMHFRWRLNSYMKRPPIHVGISAVCKWKETCGVFGE